MTKKICHLAKPKMRSRVRSWKITHEPEHVTSAGGKKQEPQGEEDEKIPKLNVIDHRWN